jgi:hypothetical protein
LAEKTLKRALMSRTCPCGSGLYREEQYDGHGIFLCYTCTKCEKEKLAGDDVCGALLQGPQRERHQADVVSN